MEKCFIMFTNGKVFFFHLGALLYFQNFLKKVLLNLILELLSTQSLNLSCKMHWSDNSHFSHFFPGCEIWAEVVCQVLLQIVSVELSLIFHQINQRSDYLFYLSVKIILAIPLLTFCQWLMQRHEGPTLLCQGPWQCGWVLMRGLNWVNERAN